SDGLRPGFPRPRLQVLQEASLPRALPDERGASQKVPFLVPIEDGGDALRAARPERSVEAPPPSEPMLREKSLERLLVFRVYFPIHLEAKTHAPTWRQCRIVNDCAPRPCTARFQRAE